MNRIRHKVSVIALVVTSIGFLWAPAALAAERQPVALRDPAPADRLRAKGPGVVRLAPMHEFQSLHQPEVIFGIDAAWFAGPPSSSTASSSARSSKQRWTM